ncbi:MAG TPA: nucleotidyltransferase domain-containing protein [Candidatus Binatia bacterium]|nr:nucleotidyltransferase domain-containing protein [Candidatus Binatia bacterium]
MRPLAEGAGRGGEESIRALSPLLKGLPDTFPSLRILALHGSRARGDADQASDWDFAYLGDGPLDVTSLQGALIDALAREDVDLVDLSRASGLMRYRVARDGRALFERTPDAFDDFRLEAALYWIDMQDVIRAEHEGILERLG